MLRASGAEGPGPGCCGPEGFHGHWCVDRSLIWGVSSGRVTAVGEQEETGRGVGAAAGLEERSAMVVWPAGLVSEEAF